MCVFSCLKNEYSGVPVLHFLPGETEDALYVVLRVHCGFGLAQELIKDLMGITTCGVM